MQGGGGEGGGGAGEGDLLRDVARHLPPGCITGCIRWFSLILFHMSSRESREAGTVKQTRLV